MPVPSTTLLQTWNRHPGLGRAIRLLRESRGLEQHQLATKSGVSPSAISDLEEGHLDPQWSTVKRLCRGLEITLGDIAERAIELDRDEPIPSGCSGYRGR